MPQVHRQKMRKVSQGIVPLCKFIFIESSSSEIKLGFKYFPCCYFFIRFWILSSQLNLTNLLQIYFDFKNQFGFSIERRFSFHFIMSLHSALLFLNFFSFYNKFCKQEICEQFFYCFCACDCVQGKKLYF